MWWFLDLVRDLDDLIMSGIPEGRHRFQGWGLGRTLLATLAVLVGVWATALRLDQGQSEAGATLYALFICSPVGLLVSPAAGAFGAHFASRLAARLALERGRWLVTVACILLLGVLLGVLPWLTLAALSWMGVI